MPLLDLGLALGIGIVIGGIFGRRFPKKKDTIKSEEKIIDINLIVSMIEDGSLIDAKQKHESEKVIIWMTTKDEDMTVGYTTGWWSGEQKDQGLLIKKKGQSNLTLKITTDELNRLLNARKKFLANKIKESIEDTFIKNAKDAVVELENNKQC